MERAAALLSELLTWRDGGMVAEGREIEIDTETLERLKAVGDIE